jgi:hypothetical protein
MMVMRTLLGLINFKVMIVVMRKSFTKNYDERM